MGFACRRHSLRSWTDVLADIYERLADGTLRLASAAAPASVVFDGAAADDGRRIWFTTTSALVPEDTDAAEDDVYEVDADGRLRLISPAGDGIGGAFFAGATPDGGWVWFDATEDVTGLGDQDGKTDLYERAADGTLRLVSWGATIAATPPPGFRGAAADGSRVFFETFEPIPGTGDADAALDVYERDAAGVLRLVTPGTAELSASWRGVAENGARVWFTTPEALDGTLDSGAQADVYERALAVPVGTGAPRITGDPFPGSALACSDGTWDAEGLAPFTREWRRDGVAIPGAVAATHTATADDLGRLLTCVVTAANPVGQAAQESPPVTVVAAPVPPPPAPAPPPPPAGTASPGSPLCRAVPAPAAPPAGDPSGFTLSTTQLLINQRIDQAAIRRANGVQAWLDSGVERRDLCRNALGAQELAPGIVTGPGAVLAALSPPDPRPVVVPAAVPGDPGDIRLSVGQLLINQRISQAAIRRLNALKARLDAGLTGGDVRDGQVGPEILAGLQVVSAPPPTAVAPASRTVVAAAVPGDPGEVTLTIAQLRINQRISQAAVRRANDLIRRLGEGLDGGEIRDGTLSALDLGP